MLDTGDTDELFHPSSPSFVSDFHETFSTCKRAKRFGSAIIVAIHPRHGLVWLNSAPRAHQQFRRPLSAFLPTRPTEETGPNGVSYLNGWDLAVLKNNATL